MSINLRHLSLSSILYKAAWAVPFLVCVPEALAAPVGGVVAYGSAAIAQSGNVTTVTQGTDRAVLDWQSFNINANETARFVQPNANSVAVNRVHDVSASTIAGSLQANGHVIITNPNGVMFTDSAKVDVGALTVSTASVNDTDAANFVSGARNDLPLSVAGNAGAKISNAGQITARDAGLVGLVAPNVENSGIIRANKGRVTLASGDTATLDLYGDGLVSLAVSKTTESRLVANSGMIQADGGTVLLTAASAADVANAVLKVEGTVQANTVSAHKGKIILSADNGAIQVTGDVHANGDSTQDGGDITANGQFVALGGHISANGKNGGTINVHATNTLSLADRVEANGLKGKGGNITLKSDNVTWETSTSRVSVNGSTDGGNIRHTATNQIISSGQYSALGELGKGGTIDVTARSTKFLGAKLNASGGTDGGQIRLGGEYQGGKNLGVDADGNAIDELKNADYLVLDAASTVDVSSTGNSGKGGTAILWSDITTLALGVINAIPGKLLGEGGFVEISSAGELQYNATVASGGSNGRAGTVLLDPKNIVIASASFNPTAIIMGYGYSALSGNLSVPYLEDSLGFAYSVALSGTQLAIGAYQLDSYDQSVGNAGGVYLYSFTDNNFTGGTLQGVIGNGYTGGKNVSVTSIASTDQFGYSVSLDGNRLAVGAIANNGMLNNRSDSGAVYLFNFTDSAFSGGTLSSTVGYGYNGAKDVNLTSYLDTSDYLGRGVSLSGNNLAIGASGDDGLGNARSNPGAVYLISFTDSSFNGGTVKGRIGYGYTGANNYNLSTLDDGDAFGLSLSLSGTRLAIAGYADDGATNTTTDAGAVYIFSFADTQFTTPSLYSIIGSGYTGGNNLNLPLDPYDNFGRGISLDGNMLAIGAIGDDGATNALNAPGAVYLFTLDATLSAAPTQQGIIGSGYTGGKNVGISLGQGDAFGVSVSLSNNRLAIAASSDDGISDLTLESGAVYLYSFTDSLFSGGLLEGRIGSGYVGTKDINTKIAGSSLFGSALSLNNNHLAVGMYTDAGFDSSKLASGAVYLYSFTSNDFDGAMLEGIIGNGYTGGKNYNLALEQGDNFGFSVSLSNNLLAVGARYDDGNANSKSNSGTAYLFSFADDQFNTATLQAIIGNGYTGGKNYNLALDANDNVGGGVSLDGTMLALGSPGDDGNANSKTDSGSVYLFTFTGDFTGLTRQATIGSGYTGGKNYNLTLDTSDAFGYGIGLNDNRLVVGAIGDDGFSNTVSSGGAAYMFTFADNLFSTAQKMGTIGYGYTATGDIDLSSTIHAGDNFGRSVALEGTTLAVGAQLDDGAGNTATNNNYGAVYVFGFNDLTLHGGALDAMIGVGYTGGKNIALGGTGSSGTNNLSGGDQLGYAVTLDNGRLIIGAATDDGYNNFSTDSGAIYMLRSNAGTNVAGGASFTTNPTGTLGLTPQSIAALLSTPQNVILQASNDISLFDPLTVNNPSGNGGTLTLQAGRSIILNSLITTDNGNINLYANEKSSTGVVAANRDAGAAGIIFGTNGGINAGTGAVTLRLDDGAGRTATLATAGDIILKNITAGSILVSSAYQYSNLILNGILSASGTGNAITLAPGGNFINNSSAGAGALALTGSGRWLIYSDHGSLNILNGLSAQEQYNCSYGSCTIPTSGNSLLYQYGNNLLRIGVNTSRQYGDANPTTTELQNLFTYSGFLNGESWADIDVKPTWSIASTANSTAAAGTSHAITFSGGADSSYSLYFEPSALNIAKKDVNVVWNSTLSKVYGDSVPLISVGNFTVTGLANGELNNVFTATANFGAITNLTNAGTYDINATLVANNYNVVNTPTTTMTIDKKEITATWTGGLTKTYGDVNPTVSNSNFTFAGLVSGGDTSSSITSSANWGAITQSSNAGTYTNGVTGVFSAANYIVNSAPATTLTINKRTLTAGLTGTISKNYDGLTAAALTSGNYSLSNIYNSDDVKLASLLNGTYANKNVGSSKTVSVTGLSLGGTKASNYQLASTSISAAIGTILQKALSITGISVVNKTYNGLTTTTLIGTDSLVGTISGDSISLNGSSAIAVYADKNVGTNKAATVSGYVLVGTDAGNYSLLQPTGLTGSIFAKALTISGLSAAGKTYDGLTTASLSGTSSLVGAIGGDSISLNNASASAVYGDKNVGTNKAITASGYALAGTDAGNYTLSQPTGLAGSIFAKALTISGLSGVDKTYDSLTTATLSGTGSLVGTIGGDSISLNSASATAAYANKNVGTNKAITASGYVLAGTDAGNYTLSQPTSLTATIFAKALSISGISAVGKTYDGLTTATLNGTGSLLGTIGGDSISLNSASASAAYGDKNVGTNKAITASGYALTGADAGNYTLSQPTGLIATILAKALSISGISAAGKTYDGLTTATLSGAGSLVGTIGGDSISLNGASASAVYSDKNIGTNKSVTASGYALAGADAGNYSLSQPTGLTATILAKALTASLTGSVSKIYDGLTAVTLAAGNYDLSGKIAGDTVSLTGGASGSYDTKNAGAGKNVSVSGLGLAEGDAGNYTLGSTSISGSIGSITPASLVVNATSGASKIYGDADLDFNYTYTGLVGGETSADFGGALARNAGENAGLYTINQGSLAATGNYQIGSFNSSGFTINKRMITAQVNDANRFYGSANPDLTWNNVTWSNLASGETGAVIDSLNFAFNGATAASNAGTLHAISITGFADNNYTLAGSTNGQLTINKAALQINANNASGFSGQPLPALTASYAGFKNGDTASVVHNLLLSSNADITSIGSFAITLSGATADNYAISYQPGTLSMLPGSSLVPTSVQQGRVSNSIQTQMSQAMTPALFPVSTVSYNTQSNDTQPRDNSGTTKSAVFVQEAIPHLSAELVQMTPALQQELQ